MSVLIFVDTNVLIYALDEADPKKQEAARVWRADLWKSRRGRISYQVLQEFYVKVYPEVARCAPGGSRRGPGPAGLATRGGRR